MYNNKKQNSMKLIGLVYPGCLIVCDKEHEIHSDYEEVARIDSHRHVTINISENDERYKAAKKYAEEWSVKPVQPRYYQDDGNFFTVDKEPQRYRLFRVINGKETPCTWKHGEGAVPVDDANKARLFENDGDTQWQLNGWRPKDGEFQLRDDAGNVVFSTKDYKY